jgi:hypothetical protein
MFKPKENEAPFTFRKETVSTALGLAYFLENQNQIFPPLTSLKTKISNAVDSFLDTKISWTQSARHQLTSPRHLVHHLRPPQGKEDGKSLLEKCPRKEKADRFPEGVSIPPGQYVVTSYQRPPGE